jgi:hypothetical protein
MPTTQAARDKYFEAARKVVLLDSALAQSPEELVSAPRSEADWARSQAEQSVAKPLTECTTRPMPTVWPVGSNKMNCYQEGKLKMSVIKRILLSAVIVVTGSTAGAVADEKSDRTVEQYSCKDVMKESGTGRDVSIAFLHGFLLGKGGSSSFNIETLTKQTDAFVDHCLNNPGDKAVEAMLKVKK